MTFHISKPVLALLLLGTVAPPSSHAFRNGNTPQTTPAVSTSTKTNTDPVVTEAPMPFKWPIIGTLPEFFSRGGVDGLITVYESMYKDYGPVYRMSLMGDDEIVFSDPQIFDQILRKEGKFPIGGAEGISTFTDYYVENDMQHAVKSMGHGPDWKEWRSSLNPDIFVLWDTYLPSIADACAKISKVAGREVTEEKTLEISDFWSRAAFDMFSAIIYGESPQTTDSRKATAEDIEFVIASKKAFDVTGSLVTDPLQKVFGGDLYKEFVVNIEKTITLSNKRGMENIRSAKETSAKHQAAAAAQAKADGSDSDSSSGGCPITAIQNKLTGRNANIPTENLNPSFIERLVSRGELAPDAITELQGPLLMAGVDTTAYAMSWFFLNMASNPEVQTKLAEELSEKLNGADLTTVDQIESLTYLQACYRESHRLTPVAPISAKTLEQDITVVSGGKAYEVSAGQRMSLNLRGMPMDPEFVEDPTSFKPERFSEDAVKARKGTPAALALDHPIMHDPFGKGKRRCIGANVAKAEMFCLAARLLQDYEISLVDPNEAVHSPTKSWSAKQKLMQLADPYPAMLLTPRA